MQHFFEIFHIRNTSVNNAFYSQPVDVGPLSKQYERVNCYSNKTIRRSYKDQSVMLVQEIIAI